MHKVKRIVAVSLILTLLTGCTSKKYNNEDVKDKESTVTSGSNISLEVSNTEEPQKTQKDYLTIATRPITSFNPLTNTDLHTKYILNLIYDNLFYLDKDLRYQSNIVNTPVFSGDGYSVTLTIRDDAIWHDKSPILADDIVYSINELINNQNPLYTDSIQYIKSVKKVDSKTVIVNFNKVFNPDTFNLCVPIVQKSFYDLPSSQLDSVRYKTNGSGKYKLLEAVDSRNYTLAIVDKYRDEATINKIYLKVIENSDLEVKAFNANIVDLVFLAPDELEKIEKADSSTIIDIGTNQYEFLALNFQNPFINNINIRRALAYAIPTEETVMSMYLNAAEVTNSDVNPDSYLYNPNLTTYTEDFQKGKRELAEAGFTSINDDGFIVKEGDPTVTLDFNILVNSENSYRENLAIKYSENLKALGIKSQVISVPFDEYMQRLNDGNYDIAFCGYQTDNSQNNVSLFTEGNVLRYTNAEVEEISSILNSATTAEEYEEGIMLLQSVVNSELPVISLCYTDELLLANNEITNADITVDNYFNNIDSWVVYE